MPVKMEGSLPYPRFYLEKGPFETHDDQLNYVDDLLMELHGELVDLGFAYEGGLKDKLATAVFDYLESRGKQ
jgi:hypothetical protein